MSYLSYGGSLSSDELYAEYVNSQLAKGRESLRKEFEDRGELYLSDRDRERLSDELREHYAAGRITLPDLERRLGRVWTVPLTQKRVSVIMRHLPGPAPALTVLS